MENLHPNGLRPLPLDERDLRLGSVFDLGDIKEVPKKNFIVGDPKAIKDQRSTDFCSGYAVTGVSATQEEVDLSPEFQFGVTKDLMGNDDWGADLRSACASACKVGSIPQILWDEVFGVDARYERDIVINRKAYPKEWDEIAQHYKKKSYWAITGEYDAFDNCRLALWKNKDKKCEIVTGAIWRSSWTKAKGGIIKKVGDRNGFGHAFTLVGQKIINGEPYLVARLSNGKDIGDDGRFYFSRGVVNKEMEMFGFFMFKDMDAEIAKVLNEQDWKDSAITRLIAQVIKLIKKIYARR